jgi:hypothetical protein
MGKALFLVIFLVGCSEYNLQHEPDPVLGPQPANLWPNTVEDDFLQKTAVASDILFVVDDSASMADEQENLANNFNFFASYLFNSDVDYHIGVVRGDMSRDSPSLWGQLVGLPPYIEPDTEYGIHTFVDTVISLGDKGIGDCESGFEASHRALESPMADGLNSGFYRDDALLLVVMVTDEDDRTTEPFCDPDLIVGAPDDWTDWFLDKKGFADLMRLGIIAGFDPDDNTTPADCESDLGVAYAAHAYRHAADQIPESITHSICNPDWSSVMTELGIAAAGLSREFNLSRVPEWDYEADTPLLEVWMDRKDGAGFVPVQPLWAESPDPSNPWEYDRVKNAVMFTIDTMPDESWAVKAVYPNSEEG